MNPSDIRSHRYLLAAELAVRAGDPDLWEKLMSWIERRGFLARQAEHFGDFDQTSRDLESHLLPELIRRGQWERFLHLALVAANLRGLAQDLDEPPILHALVRGGSLGLAEKLVAQVADPLRRAQARAALAAALPASSEAFGRLLDGLRGDLDSDLRRDALRRDPRAAAAWCDALVIIAGCLGPALRIRWPEWVEVLVERDRRDGREEGLADRAWRALAESFLRRGEDDADELWTALGAIREPGALAFVPERLAECRRADPWPLLRRLRRLDPAWGPDLAWRAAVAALGAAVGEDGGAARAAEEGWRRGVAELGAPAWSVRLIETGRRLWRALPEDRLEGLIAQIEAPPVRAALAVVWLEERPSPGAARRALEEVERLDEPAARLHWALRFLLARPPEPRRELEGQAVAVVRHLARIRWAAPAGDLRRYLDLVARVYPRHLRAQIENVLWAPAGDARILRTLARESSESSVLDELFRRAEEYAAMAGETAAEGFELRREVLVVIAGRMCAAARSLQPLHEAAERLLPEEEDELRREVAVRLAAVGEADLALEAAGGLRSRRLAFLTRLEIAPAAASLGASELYRAAAASLAFADERRSLAALQRLPSDPAGVARVDLDEIGRKGRQIGALIDLAHHALAYQQRRFRRGLQDRLAAVLPLKEALGVVESDDWLAALTPELVAVGARLGAARAVAEIQEAMERVIALTAVPWPRRRWVLLQLVTGIEGFLSDGGSAVPRSERQRAQRLIDWIGSLPQGRERTEGREELRRDWHRLLPWLRLVEERLGVVSSRGLRRSRASWSWLTPEQAGVVELCFGPPPIEGAAGADGLRALACRALREAPERLLELEALPARGTERDELILELIRFAPAGSLPTRVAMALIANSSPAARPRATAWLWWRPPAEARAVWPAPLRALAADADLDLDDPSTAPLRRRVWRAARAESLPTLALAAVEALESGGKPGCEHALRLFLNVYLAPVLGESAGPAAELRLAGVAAAEERAGELGEPAPRPSPGEVRR